MAFEAVGFCSVSAGAAEAFEVICPNFTSDSLRTGSNAAVTLSSESWWVDGRARRHDSCWLDGDEGVPSMGPEL